MSDVLLEASDLGFTHADHDDRTASGDRPATGKAARGQAPASTAPLLFSGVSLSIRRNEVVALLGASGCGKSTLLRVLAGLATPRHGQVRMDGTALAGPHPRGSMLFQQPSLLPWLRVADNVAFGLDFRRQPQLKPAVRAARVHQALAAVGLADAARLWPAQLSGGMAQRVALARALAREPAVLFADEPFSALDAITRSDMQALLREVVGRFGTAVLLVTHDIDEALVLADRILLMGVGTVGDVDGSRGSSDGVRLRAEWILPASTAARQALRPELLDALQLSSRSSASQARVVIAERHAVHA